MPNSADGQVNIPVVSTYDPAGTDGAAAGLQALAGTAKNVLSSLESILGTQAKVATPVTPKINPLVGGEGVESKLKALTADAEEFLQALRLGATINVGERIIGGIEEIGAKFKEAVTEGVNYNAEVQSQQISFANALQSVAPLIYANRDAAKAAAADAFKATRDFAVQNGVDVKSTFEALAAAQSSFFEHGFTDTAKQIEFISTIISAEAAKGISGQRALIDAIDLITGRVSRITFAKEIGLDEAAFKAAAEKGQDLALIMDKLAGYKAGLAEQGESYKGLVTSVGELVRQLEGETFAPVFAELSSELAYLKEELKKPDVQEAFRAIGYEVAEVVHAGDSLLNFVLRNAAAFTTLANVAVAAGAAFSGMKVLELVSGLVALAGEAGGAAAGVGELATAAGGAEVGLAGLAGVAGGPLVVAVVAAGAVILKLIADMDAATARSAELGASFDKVRQKPGAQVGTAQDPQAFEVQRRKLLDEIAREQAIVNDPANRVPIDNVFDDDGKPVVVLGELAKQAQQQVTNLTRELNNLAAVKLGGLDVSNIAPVKPLQEGAKLTAEQKASLEGIGKLLDDANLKEQDKSAQLQAQKTALQEQIDKAAEFSGLTSNIVENIRTSADFQQETANLSDVQKAKLADYLGGIVQTRAEVDKLQAAEDKQADQRAKKIDGLNDALGTINDKLTTQRQKLAEAQADPSKSAEVLRIESDINAALDDQKKKRAELAQLTKEQSDAYDKAHPDQTARRAANQKYLDDTALTPDHPEHSPEEIANRAKAQQYIAQDDATKAGKTPLPAAAPAHDRADPNDPFNNADGYGDPFARTSSPAPDPAVSEGYGDSFSRPSAPAPNPDTNPLPPGFDTDNGGFDDGKLGDVAATVQKTADDINGQAGDVATAQDNLNTSFGQYHDAVMGGFNTVAETVSGLASVVQGNLGQYASLAATVAQMQITLGNISNGDGAA